MLTKYVASVNILRDSEKDIYYIPTPNGRLIADHISNGFKRGTRAFNLVGTYGTGKSAFLLAYQNSVLADRQYFDVNILPNAQYRFINFVGEYKSIQNVFAKHFNVQEDEFVAQNIFSSIFNAYFDLTKKSKNAVLFLVVDEFGKFLEYAFKNSPERELYFIQQLSEFVTNTDNNIVLITAVHQNFDGYGGATSVANKQEWSKVRGRFRELAFNEPIEQLLFLAANQINNSVDKVVDKKKLLASVNIFIKGKAFRFDQLQINTIAEQLYPLELYSAYILTSSLQRYGQNERSLFSFLNSVDNTGLENHIKNTEDLYALPQVYDYLIYNFYSSLQTIENPNFSAWQSIKYTLETVERAFTKQIKQYSDIIKSIGLLAIFAEGGAKLDKEFLINYSKTCLAIESPSILIEDLERKKIIQYRNYSSRYIFPEGTDLDIQSELLKASNKVEVVTDVTTLLNKYYELQPVIAKEITYRTGTPRIFEYIISEYPKNIIPDGETDGFINLIFNENLDTEDLIAHSGKQAEAVLYAYYRNSASIRDLLFEIEKTKKVIEENLDDKVAVKELNNIIEHQQNLLNHKILDGFYTSGKDVIWIYNGSELAINSKKKFNNILSDVCANVYNKSPRFNNELINKHKLSGSIHGAKKNYLKALVNNWKEKEMGFSLTKFPPEKTIAKALLFDNDIRLYDDINNEITVSERNNLHFVWNVSVEFLMNAKTSKRNVSELTETLSKRPYKLKQGLIDFWIPTFLFIKRNDFALFHEDKYLPYLNSDILELLIKNPEEYEIKTFDVEGVKLNIFNSYRTFLQQSVHESPGNETFIETIKPFLVFHRGLSEYSKNTKRLSKEAIRVREVIATSKDPEQTFFESFPAAIGFNLLQLQENEENLQSYTLKLQEAIRELRTAYDELVLRFETFIRGEIVGENIEFIEYKAAIQARFKSLKKHLLLPFQKIFIQRLDSSIDDKQLWLNSICQAVTGTTLDRISDDEELKLYDKFKMMILELDSLTQISNSKLSSDKEELMSLEINSFGTGSSKKTIRIPKIKSSEVTKIEDELRKTLSKDASVDITALANLLKELMVK